MATSINSIILPAAAAIPTTSPPAIHPTAIIDPTAVIGEGVEIGAYTVVGPACKIGAGTKLWNSVNIVQSTWIGEKCEIFPTAVVGAPPQIHGYKSSVPDINAPLLAIGNKTKIRELVSIHHSSSNELEPMTIGKRCLIMANSHIGHDCILEDDVTIVTGVGLAGHCTIMRGAIIGGQVGMHQFCRVGPYAFAGACASVAHDVLPFSMVKGDRARTTGLNVVGLKRLGWTDERIQHLASAMTKFFQTGKIDKTDINEDVQVVLTFAKGTKRGIALPPGVSSKARESRI